MHNSSTSEWIECTEDCGGVASGTPYDMGKDTQDWLEQKGKETLPVQSRKTRPHIKCSTENFTHIKGKNKCFYRHKNEDTTIIQRTKAEMNQLTNREYKTILFG